MSDPISDALLDSLRAYDSNNHLPECFHRNPLGDALDPCICDRLRACEQRKDEEATALMYRTALASYDDGVQATRDAVAEIHRHYENGLTGGGCSVCGGRWPCETVAAIDALNV